MVGVTFGMARYGYGLLLPDMRREYGLSASALGAIATGAYAVYLVASAATGVLAARAGPRRTAVAAGLLAALGMAIAGLSASPGGLAVGILVGGASAGFAFPPFSDAAREISAATRARVLAAVSSGTGWGVALAAPIAILAGSAWRGAWLAFAIVALAATAWAAYVLSPTRLTPSSRAPHGGIATPGATWRALRCPGAARLIAGAVLVGLGSSTYWTFGVEHLVAADGVSTAASRGFLGLVGVASILGSVTGDLARRMGARRCYIAMALTQSGGIALLALLPGSLHAALASALLFGAAYNAVLAVQSLWSVEIYATRPSLGIAAVMSANGIGFVVGPLAAGLLVGPLGLAAVLGLGAGIVATASLFAPRADATVA